jgi:hypothetical protein
MAGRFVDFAAVDCFSPDSAVERKVMSKEQTFRSEDSAFCL